MDKYLRKAKDRHRIMKEARKENTEMRQSLLIGMYKKTYSHPRLVKILCYLGHLSVAIVAFSFCLALYRAFLVGIAEGVGVAIAAAIPFLAVSVLRKLLNFPRPYEVYDFSEFGALTPKAKHGQSFPSRHVLSAFLIGVLVFPYAPFLSVISLFLGVIISVCRVIWGIHFPKDVITGALIGVASGVVGILIL